MGYIPGTGANRASGWGIYPKPRAGQATSTPPGGGAALEELRYTGVTCYTVWVLPCMHVTLYGCYLVLVHGVLH
eukprot:4505676-Pyramimonas_sp.AAC.1